MSKKNKTYEFTATIQSSDRGGAFVYVPFDVEKEFGKKRVKIKATFDGAPYQGTLVRYGSPEFMLLVRKDIREKINKQAGDSLTITLIEDTAPRVVKVPADFQSLLEQHPAVLSFYEKLSYTHRKEYIQWIEGAKRSETRERRMQKALLMMQEGKKGV